jgi:NitT/TauT family transport system permease protein
MSPNLARYSFIILGLVVWEAFVRLGTVSPILVAPPSIVIWHILRIFSTFTTVPEFYTNAWITLRELIAGYFFTVFVGVGLGLAFAMNKTVADAFEPIVLVFYAIPKIILYPIVFLMLGTEMMPKIVYGFMVGVFVVILNTSAGIRQVEPVYVGLARSMGYNKVEVFFKVVIPAAAPTMLAGLRMGFGRTIIGVIVGELLVVNAGLGYLIDWAAFQYFTPELYALIIITLSLGYFGNLGFDILERRWIK